MMVCEQHKPIQYSHKIFFSSVCDSVLIAVSLIKKKNMKEKDESGLFKKRREDSIYSWKEPSTVNPQPLLQLPEHFMSDQKSKHAAKGTIQILS